MFCTIFEYSITIKHISSYINFFYSFMNTKIIILALSLSSIAYTAQAQEIKREMRGEQEYIFYKVQKGETVFSISKKYNIKTDLLIEHNPAIAQVIKADDMVYVPVKPRVNPKVEPLMRGADDAEDEIKIVYTKHKVAKGQGLMAIARMYNISLDELKKWNDMEEVANPSIDPDQELIVGISTSKSAKKNKESRNETANNQPKNPERTNDKPAIKKTEQSQPNKMRGDEDIIIHEIAKGETLYKIAQLYGMSEVEIMNENNLSNNIVKTGDKLKIVGAKKKPSQENLPTKPQKETGTDTNQSMIIYTVSQGDNLKKIQDKFNVSREEIRYWNGMGYENTTDATKNIITLGDQYKIYMPKKTEHTIQKGETIDMIKQKYGIVSDRPLEKWNGVQKGKLKEAFLVGKVITIFQPTGPQLTEGYIKGEEAPLPSLNTNVLEQPKTPKEQINTPNNATKIQHTVKDDQTLYEISKIYKVNVDDIKKWNNITDDIKPSQVLDIYTSNVAETPKNTKPNNPFIKKDNTTEPKVKDNNFDKENTNKNNIDPANMEDLLKPNTEQPKPKETPKPEPPKNDTKPKETENTETTRGLPTSTEVENAYTNPKAKGNLETNTTENKAEADEFVEKGLAEILTTVVSPQPNVATHKTLPTGTLLIIKNPLTKKTLTVQVVAPLTNATNPNTIVQVTRAVMEKLGVPDDKTVEVEVISAKK